MVIKIITKHFLLFLLMGKKWDCIAQFFISLPFINYAIRKKYIPVIDLSKTYLPLIQTEDRKENPWEYYYEQPVKQYTLEEVYQSRHVIIMADSVFKVKMPVWNKMFPTNESDLRHWNQIISSYVRLNSELERRVEAEQKKIFKKDNKILGVGIRAGLRAGSMRNESLYNNHPKRPSCEELMDIIEEKMQEWHCDCIFLSCDDREYLNKFIARFGDRACYIKRKLRHYFENDKPVPRDKLRVEFAGTTDEERMKEYIVEVYLLAQCHCLYSCKGGGATFAYFLNGGKYEKIEVYDKGMYTGLGNV